jgi:hypothetical protein
MVSPAFTAPILHQKSLETKKSTRERRQNNRKDEKNAFSF